MKVALLLCGQSRFFRSAYHSIKKNIIDKYNPDIYIHTWKYKNNYTYSAPWNNLGKIYIDDNYIKEYIKLYNPVNFMVEEELDSVPLDIDIERTSSKYTPYNFYSYLYSLNKCYNLIENNNKSEYIYIILRSDVYIINFPTLNPEYIQIFNKFTDRDNVIETMIVTIPYKFMDIYVDFVNKLNDYYNKGYYFNYEEMTHAHFKENNLYEYTQKKDRNEFSWGYFRGNKIEFI